MNEKVKSVAGVVVSDSTYKADNKATVITICASDPMGLSGIHADLRALESMNVHGLCCLTATTAQTLDGFSKLNPVSDEVFKSQLDSLYAFESCHVIKIGLIANESQAQILASHPVIKNKKIVLDPVLAASTGDIENHKSRLAGIKKLLPLVDIITPNLDEAIDLTSGHESLSEDDSKQALSSSLLKMDVSAVLLKGGHSKEKSIDFYCDQTIQFYLKHDIYQHQYSRGTGCAMASLIAAGLALGSSTADAVTMAKMQMQGGWQSPFTISEQSGSLGFKKWVSAESLVQGNTVPVTLPIVFKQDHEMKLEFPPCELPLGLYPIFDRAEWLEKILPLGIKIAQLRVKDLEGNALKQEIQAAVEVARKYNCQLFINDYWELAIECEAYGVHLGQEDIDDADLNALSQSGLRLGLSSHCFYEVARAKTINPSYIAFGPVYETQTKDMPWIPQGPIGLKYWREHLPNTPMVAIGGIHGDRFDTVKSTGVDSIAMITAITLADDPEAATLKYQAAFIA